MVLPKRLARFNRVAANRVLGRLTPRLPGFGTIVHRGRRSGHTYRTPVSVFAVPHGYVVALTYGRDSDWVKNVLAEGGCELVTRGRTVKLSEPRVVHDEDRKAMPFGVRHLLGAISVTDFLHLTAE
ncbi:MAG TPA: nitroreductase family deazaflavin-dependent oxidoreductase [Amycolatopsis sp.]|uniref:nitroreductase family deazaflavin-dependent oxidoreductase n=1 Tax=Amycolatopsis sp. TaxID=37632 RepID=UPI002B49F399|nr:nitroreductase family deazaflavin-dependent oxidoreductase [Amycolatopsis sp.]HKS47893.1 nitroreductase family deazaflavin-dependent oxidoreductase [Amycolatopsis sp.]